MFAVSALVLLAGQGSWSVFIDMLFETMTRPPESPFSECHSRFDELHGVATSGGAEWALFSALRLYV